MAVAVPQRQQGIEPTWETFCKSLRDAFAAPNKEFNARMQLRRVKQLDKSAVEYVRRVRSLIASITSEPPSMKEQILALYDGMNPAVQQKAAVDPHTGKFWESFDALASYIIALETQAPKFATRPPAFGPKPVKAKNARLHTISPARQAHQPRGTRFQTGQQPASFGQPGGRHMQGGRGRGRGPFHPGKKQRTQPVPMPAPNNVTLSNEQFNALLGKK